MNFALFGLGRSSLLQRQLEVALSHYRKRLAVTDSKRELRDEMELLAEEHPYISREITAVLDLLKDWEPQKKPGV